MGPVRSFVALVGAAFIYALIRLFGRKMSRGEVPWLEGPLGSDFIGDRPYEECAEREGLELERNATEGGLLTDMEELRGPEFDPESVHALVRDFYEHTACYEMDVWARSSFPANVALWLLVTTISRKVDQLNFPLRVLDTAKGVDSEIALLRERGEVKYVGWYRRLVETGRSVYTGFYMSARVPREEGPCVKVVFPMPEGNATVILRPRVGVDGELELHSDGDAFGGSGFYRIQKIDADHLRVWKIRSLRELFRVYVDEHQTLRCDHHIRFLGLPIVQLHYKMRRKSR